MCCYVYLNKLLWELEVRVMNYLGLWKSFVSEVVLFGLNFKGQMGVC